MPQLTKRRIERAAKAIRFLVPIDNTCRLKGDALALWTPKGLAEVKWPKDFGKDERRLIRKIAKTVLEAANVR